MDHRFVFVGGLHRSGTTIVTDCIKQHPDVSGFSGTGAREDEGQFLQSVYPTAGAFGGPGRWGFAPEARLNERSPLVSDANRLQMLDEWSRHWDLTRPVLLEKSPPNLLRARFLQAMFPASSFVMVVRHPVAVSYATWTRRRRKTRLPQLLEHWVVCHEQLVLDAPHIRRLLVVPYEEFVSEPDAWLRRIFAFLGLDAVAPRPEIRSDTNERYFAQWRHLQQRPVRGLRARRAAAALEHRVRSFGYSLTDLDRIGPGPALAGHGG